MDVELNHSLHKYSGMILRVCHMYAGHHVELPALYGCMNTACYTLSNRVRIPDLFPVQQLSALNFTISLIRPPPQIKNNHLESFPPSSLPCICNRRKMEWFAVLSWYRFYEQCFDIMPKGKLSQLNQIRVAKKVNKKHWKLLFSLSLDAMKGLWHYSIRCCQCYMMHKIFGLFE